MSNPYASYQAQAIQTMTAGEMINALYEGLIKQINFAIIHIDEQSIAGSHQALIKAQDIVAYLHQTLNMEIPVSQSIAPYYTFFQDQLILANLKKDKQILEAILPLVIQLRDVFNQADRMSRTR